MRAIKLKPFLIKLHWFFSSELGIDPRRFLRSLRGVPLYLRDRIEFRKRFKGKMRWMPCMHDRYEEAGVTSSEYFWQDLLVARAIHDAEPERHVDVGSRIDGFVAHVASFREIEVLDVRQVTATVPGVVFQQVDMMSNDLLPDNIRHAYCDSLSCLHALEHFGLGRYGDPINPQGYRNGIANMAKTLEPGGTFYLSTPIGQERVEFNAHWVFNPRTILKYASYTDLSLQKLIVITPSSGPVECSIDDVTLTNLANKRYQLGLFIFTKELTQ